MFAAAGNPTLGASPLNWSLLFALQPEPDLEFTEEELEQTTQLRPASSKKRPKKSGGRPLLWILLLILAGGAVYIAMEPEVITDVLGPLLGEESLTKLPSASLKPVPPPPSQRPFPAQPGTSGVPGTPPSVAAPAPNPAIPAPVPAPAQAVPSAPALPSTPTVPPVVSSPIPMFAEGQKVTVALDLTSPGDSVTLSLDPAGTKPGVAVRPGATLTVLDGDLQGNVWVYSVRGDDGAKGWVSERRLRLKP